MKMERLLEICSWLLVISGFLGFIGLSWDVQWHGDVGPDSFFTPPHAVFYSSAAINGIVSLFVGIAFTRFIRTYPKANIEYRSLAGMKGPVGYILSGLSAVIFICSGFYDLWWHTVYGFDVTLVSPSHFGLFFSSIIGSIGLLYIFASASERAKLQDDSQRLLRNQIGFALGMASLFMSLTPFLMISLIQLKMIGIIIGYPVFATVFFTSGLAGAAAYTKRFGMATCCALYLSLAKLVTFATIPGLVAWLANREDLFYKHDAAMFPVFSTSLPLWLAAMGLFIDLWQWAVKKLKVNSLIMSLAGGSIAATLLYVLDPRWTIFAGQANRAAKQAVISAYQNGWWPTLALVILLGALCAVIGSKIGESFIYSNMRINALTPDGRKLAKGPLIHLILITLGTALLMPASAFAHVEAPDNGMVQVGKLNAGPYGLTVLANEYPIKAKKSLQIRIVPEGGIEGLKGTYRLMLPGSNRKELNGGLFPYPGVKDAWVVNMPEYQRRENGCWRLRFKVPKAKGMSSLEQFNVLPPPGIPMWVGWLIGLIPLYLLIAFFISEVNRIRKLKKSLAEKLMVTS